MKTTLSTLATLLLLASGSHALAASTVDLAVKGLITPNACTPTLSGGGKVDYGKVSAKDLKLTNSTALSEVILQLTIDCEASTAMAFKLIDNRPGTSTSQWSMGLGLTPAQEKIGSVGIWFANPVVDNQAVQMSESEDNGETWSRGTSLVLHSLLAPSSLADASQPIPSTHFSTDLRVYAVIARADSLTLTDEVAFEGNGTIEVHYL